MGKNHIYPQGPHRLRSLQPELTAVWGHKWIYSEHRMRTVAEPCRRPCSLHWCEIRTGAPTISMTHSAGRAAALVSNFPLEDSSLRGEQSLCWGRYNVANVSLLLLPSHALCLSLWGAGGYLNLTLVFQDVLLLNRCNLFLGGRRQWHPTPVLLPGKSHGWRSLVDCSPWGREESDTTE